MQSAAYIPFSLERTTMTGIRIVTATELQSLEVLTKRNRSRQLTVAQHMKAFRPTGFVNINSLSVKLTRIYH